MTNDDIKGKIRAYAPDAVITTQEDDVKEYMEKKFPGVRVVMENKYVNFRTEKPIGWFDLKYLMDGLNGTNLSVLTSCSECSSVCAYFYTITL